MASDREKTADLLGLLFCKQRHRVEGESKCIKRPTWNYSIKGQGIAIN